MFLRLVLYVNNWLKNGSYTVGFFCIINVLIAHVVHVEWAPIVMMPLMFFVVVMFIRPALFANLSYVLFKNGLHKTGIPF